MAVLAALACRPVSPNGTQGTRSTAADAPLQRTQPVRDLLLALDLSQSMDTRDFKTPTGALEPRVDAVRQVVADFVARRPGDRIGLIVFGDAPYPLAPFTLDHALVRKLIADMVPGMAGSSTSLGDAIGLGIKMLGIGVPLLPVSAAEDTAGQLRRLLGHPPGAAALRGGPGVAVRR